MAVGVNADRWRRAESHVAEAIAGSEDAIRALVAEIEPAVRSLVRRACALHPNDVDDVVQEILVAVWRSLPKYRREATVRTWVFRVTWCVVARSRRRRLVDAATQPVAAPPELLARDESSVADSRLDALTLLRRIPRDRAFILYLRYFEDMSDDEIAHVLNISQGTVASRGSRGLRDIEPLVRVSLAERNWR